MHDLCMMNADRQTFLTQTTSQRISTQTSDTTSQERNPGSSESIQSAGDRDQTPTSAWEMYYQLAGNNKQRYMEKNAIMNMFEIYAHMYGLCMMNADKQTFLTQTGFTGISTQASGTTSQEIKPKSPESNQFAGDQR